MPIQVLERFAGLYRFAVVGLALFGSWSSAADETLYYGVQPFIPPLYLEKAYGAFIQELSAQINKPIQFRTRRNVTEYRRAIDNEEFDIILVNPFEYIKLRGHSNYRGLVRRTNRITAKFYVIDKNIDSLEKLRGRVIGFPPLEMGNAILGLQKLHEVGVYPDQYKRLIFNEHLSCKQALSNGLIDACVSSALFAVNRLQTYDKEYIAIASGRDIPSSVIMIHNRIQALEEPLRRWLLGLNTSEHGRAMLAETILGELGEITDAEYDSVLEILEDRKQKGW